MNSYKKYHYFCFLFLIILSILFFCCKEKESIKVGFVGPLTGTDFGTKCRNGVIFAIDEINDLGGINGRRLELITKDDKGDVNLVKKVDKELIDEGVVAIIGHPLSTMSLEALPIINKYKVLMISPTSSSNELTKIDDYFLRVEPPNIYESYKNAEYLYNELNVKSISALYDLSNGRFSKDWFNHFKEKFISLGGEINIVLEFTAGKVDKFQPFVNRLLEKQPDALLIIADALNTAFISQQTRKLGFDKVISSSAWAMTNNYIKNSGKSGEGTIFVTPNDIDNNNERYINYEKKYIDIFDEEPQFHSINSYEALMVLSYALINAKNYSADELKREIIKKGTFEGLQGKLYIDKYGDAYKEYYVVTVKDSKFIKIK